MSSQLVRLLQQVGFAASADESALAGLLRQTSISEQDVAEVLSMMAQTQGAAAASGEAQQQQQQQQQGGKATSSSSSSGSSSWNWKNVVDAINRCTGTAAAAAAAAAAGGQQQQGGGLSWARVSELLDHPSFQVPDATGFALLAGAFRHASGEQLPVRAFCGRVWDNHAGQLSFLRHAVACTDLELFSFRSSERKAAPLEVVVPQQQQQAPTGGGSKGQQQQLQQAGPATTTLVGTPNEAWLSIDLLQVLCYLFVEPAHQPVVRHMLQAALKECPEVGAGAHAHMHACTCAHTHACTHMPMHTHACMHACMHLQTPTHAHVHMHAPAHTHARRPLGPGSRTCVQHSSLRYTHAHLLGSAEQQETHATWSPAHTCTHAPFPPPLQVLLVSMAAVPPMEWSLLQREVFSLLLPVHLASSSPTSQAVLRRLWSGAPGLVAEALVEYVAQDAGNLPRVLDICQDLQVRASCWMDGWVGG